MGTLAATPLGHPRRAELPHGPEAGPQAEVGPGGALAATLCGLAVEVHDDPEAVAAEWLRFQARADGTVFQTYEWLAAWRRTVGPHHAVTPAIVLVREPSGEPALLLPLGVERGRWGRRLVWLGRELNDYNGPLLAPALPAPLSDPEGFARFWAALQGLLQRSHRWRHGLVRLDKMPGRVGAQANPFLVLPTTPNPNGAWRTALGADWPAFYAARRSAATRGRDRSKLKRLAAHGETRMLTAATPAEAAATLDTLVAQKSAAFARAGVPSIFERPGYLAFYRDLVTHPDMGTLVHVSRLAVGGESASANLGLHWRGVYYHVLASHTGGELRRLGPGAAHLRELMRHAIGQGLGTFDFTIGDEPYKREWSDTELTLYDHLAAATWHGRFEAAGLGAWVRLKRAVKRNPALWQRLSRARAGLKAGIGAARRAPT